jgi:release factor glutamine methyltransferase
MTPASMPFGPVTVQFDDTVLRPRSWTLAQSEWAAELAIGIGPGAILELCCGAGHIGLAAAVLSSRPLVQVDLSEDACRWAKVNASAAGARGAQPVEVRCGSFAEVLQADETFPLVIADPPYVPRSEVAQFPEDPRLAIDGGSDGLAVVFECLAASAEHVAVGGSVLLQVRGLRQAAELEGRTGALSITEVRVYGPDRAVVLLVA